MFSTSNHYYNNNNINFHVFYSDFQDVKNLVCHKAARMFTNYLNYTDWRYYHKIYLRFDILISRYD